MNLAGGDGGYEKRFVVLRQAAPQAKSSEILKPSTDSLADPDNVWPKDFPHCGENRQSPIDIDTAATLLPEASSNFSFSSGYRTVQEGPLTNNGHSGKSSEFISA